jgi:transposase-like protein
MEINPLRRQYTDLEKQQLIEQWKNSGKNKTDFCKENSLNYYSFCDWIRKRKKRSAKNSSFVPVHVRQSSSKPFAELTINGTSLVLHHPVEAAYLQALLK